MYGLYDLAPACDYVYTIILLPHVILKNHLAQLKSVMKFYGVTI